MFLLSNLKNQRHAASFEAYYKAGSCCPTVCLSSHLVSKRGCNTLDIRIQSSHLYNYYRRCAHILLNTQAPSEYQCNASSAAASPAGRARRGCGPRPRDPPAPWRARDEARSRSGPSAAGSPTSPRPRGKGSLESRRQG